MEIKDHITTVFIIIIVLSFLLSVLQIIELIRYFNYGKINKEKNAKTLDCKWNYKSKSVNNITIYNCIKPKIIFKNKLCKGICRNFRYKNIPQYSKSLGLLIGESIVALINFVILIITFSIKITGGWKWKLGLIR